ncbi:hypothetical protein EVAR_93751_1 [Eumeta japonica]|uniref:Uncharacterized protein n=1 Tax=Eumeta variegata TaxID=151549 RepID=A0A4C2AEQ6_EUMVA|nr:hypothetical protein EVAR_93751_1 [Eumeta japonica]
MFRKEKSFLYGESHVLGAARLRLTTFTCLGKVGKASRKGGRIRTNLKCPHTGGRVEGQKQNMPKAILRTKRHVLARAIVIVHQTGFAEVLILIDTKLPRTGPKGSAPSSDESPCGFDRSVRDHVERTPVLETQLTEEVISSFDTSGRYVDRDYDSTVCPTEPACDDWFIHLSREPYCPRVPTQLDIFSFRVHRSETKSLHNLFLIVASLYAYELYAFASPAWTENELILSFISTDDVMSAMFPDPLSSQPLESPVGPGGPRPLVSGAHGREGTDCISKDVDVTSNDLSESSRSLTCHFDFRIGNGAICSSKLVEYDFLRTRDPAGWILRLRNVLAAVFQNGQTNDYRDTETSPVQCRRPMVPRQSFP